MSALILACSILILAAAVWCDRRYNHGKKVDADEVADLRDSYREFMLNTKRFPVDRRVEGVANLLAQKYYRQALDETYLIDPENIDTFVQNICALDQKIKLPSLPNRSALTNARPVVQKNKAA